MKIGWRVASPGGFVPPPKYGVAVWLPPRVFPQTKISPEASTPLELASSSTHICSVELSSASTVRLLHHRWWGSHSPGAWACRFLSECWATTRKIVVNTINKTINNPQGGGLDATCVSHATLNDARCNMGLTRVRQHIIKYTLLLHLVPSGSTRATYYLSYLVCTTILLLTLLR
jgi:hypothetical protein